MTNLNIRGGIVSLEDGIKAKEEYAPPRKAHVELHFDVPEGADPDAHVHGVLEMTKAHLHRLLHNKATEATAHVAAATGAAEGPKEPKPRTARAAAPKEPEAAVKTKADLEREHLASLKATEAAQKTTVEDDGLGGGAAPAPSQALEDDGLGDLLGDTAPIPVTDQELGKAAQEKNGAMKGVAGWAPEKIRELVGRFVLLDGKPKPGAKLQEIPAAQRHDFLAQLKALK